MARVLAVNILSSRVLEALQPWLLFSRKEAKKQTFSARTDTRMDENAAFRPKHIDNCQVPDSRTRRRAE